MNDFRIVALVLVLVVISIAVGILNPQMPKKIKFEDANFVLTQEGAAPHKKVVMENILPKVNPPKAGRNVVKETEHNEITPIPQLKQNPIEKMIKNLPPQIVPQKIKTKLQPKIQSQRQPQVQPQRQLTDEEEEIIAWNKWRSDLQNRIMRDTRIGAPVGTVFRFSFTVDRYGTISNLKTWSDDSQYTSEAVRIIKPKLLSYQGQSILNFPPKSKRVITNVNGSFTIWYTSGYSSPSDYSDYERIK